MRFLPEANISNALAACRVSEAPASDAHVDGEQTWVGVSSAQVAGVVQAEHPGRATGAELEGGDGADRVAEAPEAGEVDCKHIGEEGEDDEVVGYDADGAVGVPRGERLDGRDGALLDVEEAFAARHRALRALRARPGFE